MKIWNQWKYLQNFPLLILTPTLSCRGTCCKIMSINSEQLPEDLKLSKLCCDAGLKIVEKGQFFITLDEEEGPGEVKNQCREFTLLRSKEVSRVSGFSETRKSARSWMWRFAFIKDVTVLKSWSNICFETEHFLGFELWMGWTNTQSKR